MRDIVTQYTRVSQGAGFAEKAHRGRLRFDGADAVSFLQALVTADLTALESDGRRYSTYLTPNGRMLADLTIFRRRDHLLTDAPASRTAALADRFDSLVFSEDVRVSDVSAAIAQFSVIGAGAAGLISPDSLAALSPEAFAARADDATVDSFDVFVPASAREDLARALGDAGALPMSPELVDVFRIEAARPMFGVDMNEDTIPLEAGLLDRAISTTKGCYVGQEIIIRVLHRGGGRVAKRLVKLACEPSMTSPPAAGATLSIDDAPVGAITSAVFSPASGCVVALGYVSRDAASPGAGVTVAGHGTARIISFAG